jgi:citrate lyase subunit beta/citryl-CoA lyase
MESLAPGPGLLFCPADRPDRFGKAATAADLVILDLEDGVAPGDRATARRYVREAWETGAIDNERFVVRVNPAGTPDHEPDLQMLDDTGIETVMLAKAERAEDVQGVGARRVIALCETAKGVLNAATLAAEPNTVALMWGAEDLAVSLGGRSSRFADGRYRDVARHARSAVLLAAGAHRKIGVDAVYLNIPDLAGLREEAEDAAESGFGAKACIHPTQVAVVREAFAPSAEQSAWAGRVLEAAKSQPGVFAFEGRMVDQPILDQARRMLGSRA